MRNCLLFCLVGGSISHLKSEALMPSSEGLSCARLDDSGITKAGEFELFSMLEESAASLNEGAASIGVRH